MSLAYTYEFILERGSEKRALRLRVYDRREFLLRELRKLPDHLGYKLVESQEDDVVIEGENASTRIRPQLRAWLGTFLSESEVDDLLGRPFEAMLPNCS